MDDYYAIVGVEPTASAELIAGRFRDQLRLWQQRTASADLDRRHHAERRLKLLNDARTVLLDAEKRRRYDRELTANRVSAPSTTPPSERPPDQPAELPPEDEAAIRRRRRFGTLPEPVPPDEWIGESEPGDVPFVPPAEPLGTPHAG